MAAFIPKHSISRIKTCFSSTSSCSPVKYKQLLLDNTNRKVLSRLLASASIHTHRRATNHILVSSSQLYKFQKSPSFGAQVLSARWNSSSTVSSTSIPPTELITPYIPPPPSVTGPPPSTTDFFENLNSLGEPTLSSLGLGSWWPSGLAQQALEMLHVNLDLPWWGSIVGLTVALRTLMIPVYIKTTRKTITDQNAMPGLTKYQKKCQYARDQGNVRAVLEAGSRMAQYQKENDMVVNEKIWDKMPKSMLVQGPVFMSMVYGIRNMADLPVASMSTGGTLWFPDLLAQEAIYGLPIMTCVTAWLTIRLGSEGMVIGTSFWQKVFMNGLPFIMLPFIWKFPSASLLYWFTSNAFTLLQTAVFRVPVVRTTLKIPKKVQPEVKPGAAKKGLKEQMMGALKTFSSKDSDKKVQERELTNYRKAATGPVVETFSYNPKKRRNAEKLLS